MDQYEIEVTLTSESKALIIEMGAQAGTGTRRVAGPIAGENLGTV